LNTFVLEGNNLFIPDLGTAAKDVAYYRQNELLVGCESER